MGDLEHVVTALLELVLTLSMLTRDPIPPPRRRRVAPTPTASHPAGSLKGLSRPTPQHLQTAPRVESEVEPVIVQKSRCEHGTRSNEAVGERQLR